MQEVVVKRLDLRGYVCPYPQLATLKELRNAEPGTLIEVITDSPPSCENVPAIARREGHEVLAVEEVEKGVWRILIRRR